MEPSDHLRVDFDILTAKLEHGALRILRIPLIFTGLNRHYLGNTRIQNRLAEERYQNCQCCTVRCTLVVLAEDEDLIFLMSYMQTVLTIFQQSTLSIYRVDSMSATKII